MNPEEKRIPAKDVNPATVTVDDFLAQEHADVVWNRWESAEEVKDLRLALLLRPYGGPIGYLTDWAIRLYDKRESLCTFLGGNPELADMAVPPLPEAASAILNRPTLQLEFDDVSVEQWMHEHTHQEDAQAATDLWHEIARLRTALDAKTGDYDDVEDAFHSYDTELGKLETLSWATLERAQDEAKKAIERANASTRDVRLPVEVFPYRRRTAKGLQVATNHSANYVVMLKRSGFTLSYDVIEKEVKVTIHGQPLPKSDHEGEVLLRRATDLCVVNGLPVDGLQSTLTSLAAGNQVNPVVAYLSTLVWDDKPRFEALAKAVGPTDIAAANAAFRLFLVQACAAADGAQVGMRMNPAAQPKYETVLVLQGEQGTRKTSGLRRLLPAPLRGYMQDGVQLAVGDRDSERQAISSWVTELGEFEATVRRSDVERLKAFLSKREDRLRVAYGRSDSRFQRRTVFVASANSEKILSDLTGSRRFAVLSITSMEIGWGDEEIDQLWAEAWHRYSQGEQWWPIAEEESALRGAAERFETASDVEERLVERYDWERGMEGVRSVQRLSLSKILDLIRSCGLNGRGHTNAEMMQARETIRRLWRKHGAKIVNGVLSVRVLDEWIPIYASGGKNSGFLLPAERAALTDDGVQGLL